MCSYDINAGFLGKPFTLWFIEASKGEAVEISKQLIDLLKPAAFWEDDKCESYGMSVVGGVKLGITSEKGRSRWTIQWPDQKVSTSCESFATTPEAKRGLRAFVEYWIRERTMATEPPATVSFGGVWSDQRTDGPLPKIRPPFRPIPFQTAQFRFRGQFRCKAAFHLKRIEMKCIGRNPLPDQI
jgi:hypothetical protein